MLASLALLLPLLATADAYGGSHYVANRVTDMRKRDARPEAAPEADPLGGSHYVPGVHRQANIPVRRAVEVVYVLDEEGHVVLDERGIPVTTTTTIVVPMTSTNVVWVTETEYHPEPTGTASASASSDHSQGASTGSPSPAPTTAPDATTTGWWTAPTAPWWTAPTSPWWTPQTTKWWPPPDSSSSTADPSSQTPSAASSAQPSSSQQSQHNSSSDAPSPSATPSSSDPAVSPSASSSAHRSPTHPTTSPDPTTTGWWTAPTSPWWTPETTQWWPTGDSSSAVPSSTAVPTQAPSQASSDAPSQSPSPSPSHSPSAHSSVSPSPTTSDYVPTPTNTLGTLMNGYFADWAADQLPPENIDWTVYDVINFAFAETAADATVKFTQWDSEDLLTRLVTGAHNAGKKALVSVGGWTGSVHFSSIVADATLRSTFVSNLVAMNTKYNLDGLDLDWEYPGAMGAAGNEVSSSDTANFLTFLKELRAALPEGALITAATQVWPFYGSNGQPLSDVSDFADVLDWILIMNYDIWGASSDPGPNAPLSDGCHNSEQPTANAYAAVASWTAAGMPANKITLGVPGYGYLQASTADHLYNRRAWRLRPQDKRQSVTLLNSEGSSSNGQIGFADIVKQGALKLSNGQFAAAGGFVNNWDNCSSTPWLKSTASGQIVTYDDQQSMNLKGQFAKQAGLKGASIWSLDGDYVSGRFYLTEAVRAGMGI